MSENIPLCAVFMITYNQEAFVAQAIESVMAQQTTFPYLLVIGEDASTDSTPEICKSLSQKYPGKILLQANKENKGMLNNAMQVYKACYASGAKYVAMIEGDDYWTDENKIQKQVNFLEANPGYTICFHETMLLKDGIEHPMLGLEHNTTFEISDLIRRNFIPTVSAVFRVHDFLNRLDAKFANLLVGDWAMHLMNAARGDIYYLSDNMAVYRVHGGGSWSAMSPRAAFKKYLRVMDNLNHYFEYKYDGAFRAGKKKIIEDYQNGTSFLGPGEMSIFARVNRRLRNILRRLKSIIAKAKHLPIISS
jgi:glycosyltransferase involved in cell wall biosynthesis